MSERICDWCEVPMELTEPYYLVAGKPHHFDVCADEAAREMIYEAAENKGVEDAREEGKL